MMELFAAAVNRQDKAFRDGTNRVTLGVNNKLLAIDLGQCATQPRLVFLVAIVFAPHYLLGLAADFLASGLILSVKILPYNTTEEGSRPWNLVHEN